MAGTQVHVDRVAGAELLLNHFTPGDGYEFTHQVVQKGAKKWKLSFQRACLTEFQWLVYSRVKGGAFCNYCCFFWPLDPRILARSGENTVRAAKDKDGVLTNHAQTIYHHDACIPSKLLKLCF